MLSEIEKLEILKDEKKLFKKKIYYSIPLAECCIDFIDDWVYTYDPRNNKDKIIPFILFSKQREFIYWLFERYKKQEDGIVDKCRDVGATWCFIAFAVWMLLFQKNTSITIFTFKATECDRMGDISTLFGKIRFILNHLHPVFKLGIKSNLMHIQNSKNNSDIVGACGDNPVRGGRRSIIFKDESAFYEHAEQIEAAMSESSNCKIDISTHAGTNTIFYRKVISGIIPVFISDWWDNPLHTQEWYNKKKEKAIAEGTLHIFQREIERNPQASIESVVIPNEWTNSAKINDIKKNGKIIFSLDVADEGTDTNALCGMNGNELVYLDEWSTPDPNITAKKAFWKAVEYNADELRYDNIGVGSGVKAGINTILETIQDQLAELKLVQGWEINDEVKRLEKILSMKIIGWSAAGGVIRPDESDFNDNPNREIFKNAKAQGYYKLRNEFLNTYHYVNKEEYEEDKLIYFKSMINHRLFNKFMNELSQAQQGFSADGKIIINKKPKGTKSPNLCEAYLINRVEIESLYFKWDKFS